MNRYRIRYPFLGTTIEGTVPARTEEEARAAFAANIGEPRFPAGATVERISDGTDHGDED